MTSARFCQVCGQRLDGGTCPNRWCRVAGRGFSTVFSIGTHQGALRGAITRYKYRGERALAPVFAAMIAAYLEAHPTWFEEFRVIAGVPGYRGPGSRRGWDPVGTVLADLARRVGRAWTVDPDLVRKTAETPGMAGRDWADRQAVARGPLRRALAVSPGRSLSGCSVLVVDDVMTEGSTLREVAVMLRRAGASDVAGLVLARPAWGARPGVGAGASR